MNLLYGIGLWMAIGGSILAASENGYIKKCGGVEEKLTVEAIGVAMLWPALIGYAAVSENPSMSRCKEVVSE